MKRWLYIFPIIGFGGAALFYIPYGGTILQSGTACPVCPNVTTTWGTPLLRLIRFVVLFGTLNTVLFSLIGGALFVTLSKVTAALRARSIPNR